MLQPNDQSKSLIVANIEIIQDEHGRYNLNVLHKASPAAGNRAKAPGEWLKRKSTKALIDELESREADIPLETVHGGERSGTYAHELLAISYAGWISPAFQLTVNQAFIDLKTGRYSVAPTTPQMSPSEKLAFLKDAFDFLEEYGLSDDSTRILAREQVHGLMQNTDGRSAQLPEHAMSNYFMIEDLRSELPKMPDKRWFAQRGTYGRVAGVSIQAADPDASPIKVKKFVNGAEREVNAWDNAYRNIAIAAIESYINKHLQ